MVELVSADQFTELLKEPLPTEAPAAPSAEIYGPPEPSEFDRQINADFEDIQREEDQATAIALQAAQKKNPKLYLRAMELAGMEDLPPDLVHRNIDQFEQRDRLGRARDVLKSNPPLADWLYKGDNAKAVDVENLEELNSLRWVFEAGGRATAQSFQQVEVANVNWREMFGQASGEEVERANNMFNAFTDDFGASSWVGEGFTGALSQAGIWASTIGAGIEGAAYGGVAGAAIGSAVPGIGTAAGGGTGMGIGGAVFVGKNSLVLNTGLAYAEYKNFRTEKGRLIEPHIARGGALIAGAISAGLDTASFGILLKATGLGSMLTTLGPKKAVKEALKNPAFREIAAKIGLRFAGAIGVEVTTEMVQEGVATLGGEITKGVSEYGAGVLNTPVNQMTGDFKPITLDAAMSRVGEAGRQALFATAFLGLVPMGGRMAIDYSAARKQLTDQGRLTNLVEAAKTNKMVKDDPVKAAEAVEATLTGTEHETVYLDVDSVKEFMQEEDSVEMTALSKVPDIQKKLQEAVQSGSDIAIPTAEFFAYVAPTDAAASIIKRLKFSPEGMTKKEAESFIKSLEKLKEQGLPEASEPKTSVSMDIYEKTRKAGATPDQARSYAALYGAFFDSMGSQTGRNPYDIYKAYNLDITQVTENPDQSALNTLMQAMPRQESEVQAYHGTILDSFEKFSSEFSLWPGGAIFFSSNPEYASQFALQENAALSPEQFSAMGADVAAGTPHSIPVFVDTKDFKVLDMTGHFFHDDMAEGVSTRDWMEQQIALARSEGYGGLTIKGMEDSLDTDFDPVVHDTYITWSPDTVRSSVSGQTLFQQDTSDNYKGLKRISWRDVRDNIGVAGDEYSLVISPQGRLYNLQEPHYDWADGVSAPEEAVRITGYWSSKQGTWTFGARFNAGRLTISQLAQIRQSAALAKIKPEELGIRPFDISDIGSVTLGKAEAGEEMFEVYKKGAGDTAQGFLEFLEQNPPVDNFAQGGGKTTRGAITFAPDKTTIRLFKNANLSTLLHETGHLFLQVMSDLSHGKRAYGDTLFQDEQVKPGDWVNIHGEDGEILNTAPVKVTAIVPGPNGPQLTVEGGKGIYDLSRVMIVSSSTPIDPDGVDTEVVESEVPALPIGESPVENPVALESASSPVADVPPVAPQAPVSEGQMSEADVSYFNGKYDLLFATNGGFQKAAQLEVLETPEQKRDFIYRYFPKSKEAMQYQQRKTHREQNNDPNIKAILAETGTSGGRKKANPLGVQTENLAVLNIDQTVEHVGSIIQATAKLNAAISGKQAKKVLTALRLSLRNMRKGAEAGTVNDQAWAELERDINIIQSADAFPAKVRDVVNEYIALYKKDEALRSSKEEGKAKRAGEKAAKQVEAARSEDIAAAITELATVVQRIEKVEQQKEASAALLADMKILQAWLGEEGPIFSTKAHEKFAVGFEAYLFEGVAPSPELASVFDRFKTWLKLVYRKIANLGVRATPEVKAVFDRMLTIDQAIQNEISSPAFQPSFSSAEEMGVPQAEFDAYMANVNAIAEVGRKAAEKVATNEASKLRTRAVQDKKKELRRDFEAELLGQRVYRTIKYLQGNKLGGVNGLKSVKLDRARVEAIVGRGKLNTIPNGNSMWAKTGGVDPNMVATMFGYNSGAEMLAEIASVEPLKIAVEDRVNKAVAGMVDEDFITPPEVAEMAAAKLRSGVYQEFIKTEIRTFSKLMGIDFGDAHVAQFSRMAADIVGDKSVRTVERRNFLREYTEADRKIGRLLDDAIKKKDYAAVLDLRRKQLFNSFLVQQAYDAKSKTTSALKYLKAFNKSKASVIDQAYLSQIRNLVIGLGLVKGQIDPTARPFSKFLDEELDSGAMIVVDPRVKRPDNRPYRALSHGELMAVHDAVKNLDFMGRAKRKLYKEGRVFDLNLAVAEIAVAMESHLLPIKESSRLNVRGMEWVNKGVKSYFSSHIKIEQLCDWIDGRAPQGPAHRYIFQPMADAQAREVALTEQYAQKVLEIVRRKETTYWSDEMLVPEIGKRVKRSEALAVALNMGNESNLRKLKKGMGWTDEQLAAVTDRLDEADWKIAQDIWDTIDGLWPLVLEVAAKTGIPRPDKVEPVSFTNKFGTFRGGYYPMVYDPAKSADALARGLTTKAEQQFGFQPQSVFPAKSFANDRDNEYARPILLDMQVLPGHIAKVVHYVTHAEAAYNVQRIMSHSNFKDRLLGHFGESMFENMKGWIENITRGETDVAGLGHVNRFMRALRRNISLAALGFRATTVIAQAGGVFSGAEMIGMTGVARGLKEMYGTASIEQIQQNFEFVRSRSPEMKNRTQFLDRDLTHIGAAFEEKGYVQRIRDVAMMPMMVADNIVATGVWMGAYTAQMKRNIHDEATAIAYADKVVRLTQGSAGAKDLSAMQRGNEFFKLFTMFYTYFAAMQNRLTDIGRTARYKRADAPDIPSTDTPHAALRFLYLIVLPSVIFDSLMKGAMQGDFDEEKEKDKSLLGSALWKIVSYSLGGMVGVRDLVSFIGKNGFEWRYSTPPVMRSVEMMLERAGRMGVAATDENKDVRPSDAFRTVVDAVGVGAGVPLDAPTLIIQNYLKAQEKGEDIGLADFFVRR